MQRDIHRLEQGPWDLLVIGGGIYGAWTAYDAALRGFKVALIEKGDWASGTSSTSSKLIHGGLRYLDQFRFGLVRKSLGERRRLALLAPHRVAPLRFLIPVYRGQPVGPLRLRTGLRLYDFIAGKNQPVKPHDRLGPAQVLAHYPFLKQEGLRAGYTYGDCQMDDARFALEIIDGASRAGAITVNYAEARELLIRGGKAAGAIVTDRETGDTMEVAARVVVNTAGPWAPELGGQGSSRRLFRLTKGVHLVMPPLPTGDALLIMVKRDGRIFFMIPWYGKTLLGTTDTDFHGDPDAVRVEEEDIAYLLGESNAVFQEPLWDRSSILGRFAGLRALRNQPGRLPSQLTREWSLAEPLKGLLISVGGKYTSARAEAAMIVARAARLLQRPAAAKAPTEIRPFPWAPAGPYREWREASLGSGLELGVDRETAEYHLSRYGTTVEDLHAWIRKDPSLAARLTPDLPFCRAEVVHGVSSEMALHLEDLLRRRLPLLILSRTQRQTMEEAAALAAPLLRWTEQRCREEVSAVMQKWEER